MQGKKCNEAFLQNTMNKLRFNKFLENQQKSKLKRRFETYEQYVDIKTRYSSKLTL